MLLAHGKYLMANIGVVMTNKRTGRGPSTPIEVKELVWEMAGRTHGPKEIHDLLNRLAARGEWPADVPLPGLRAIQQLVSKRPVLDPSAPWTVGTDQTGEPRVVLDTLAAVIELTDGRQVSIPQNVAAMLIQVSRAAPELGPIQRWVLARRYAERHQAKEATDDLDAFIAFAPWCGGVDAANRYQKAILAGFVAQAPISVLAEFSDPGVRDALRSAADTQFGGRDEDERAWALQFQSIGQDIRRRMNSKTVIDSQADSQSDG